MKSSSSELMTVSCTPKGSANEYSENGDAFFDLVRGAGIPLITLSDVKFRRAVGGKIARKGGPLPAWRHQYDAGVAELLAPHHFDLGVMAGYLLIITEYSEPPTR